MNAADRIETGDRTPSDTFGDLFAAVAMMNIVPAKDWADAAPKSSPAHIIQAYRGQRPETPAAMLAFVRQWFDLPASAPTTAPSATIGSHIEATWPALIRHPSRNNSGDSLLPLPEPSLAPGGRFRECYYWDTYFTLVGLRHRPDLVRASAENFRWQIGRYGFVPNANRTYYLSRSQPPFLFKIVELLSELEGEGVVAQFLPALIAEHRFWMSGAEDLCSSAAFRRVVRLPDGAVLNRYWDDVAAPRDESWRLDISTAQSAPERDERDVWRDVRAACESGWDFSSRWLAGPDDLGSIMTTSLLPSDLNSVLFGLEQFIADAAARAGDATLSDRYAAFAGRRREAMSRYLWNDALGAFDDYDWKGSRLRGVVSAAAASALFFGLANDQQARATASLLETRLLAPGGLLTTTEQSDQQWDGSNGWAPLQWIATEGLARYGFQAAASEIRARWLRTVEDVFHSTGRMFEKYDVVLQAPGGGGEYALQDGFGWTNGVTKAFLRAE